MESIAPTSQSLANYMLLAIFYGGILIRGRNGMKEFFMKTADQGELLAMLGLFGCHCWWCASAAKGETPAHISGSTMLNLSLLTSDMWSVLIRIFVYHEKEFFMKTADQVELLAMLGFFGAIVGVLPYAGFAVAMFLFYSGVPLLLKISGSMMLNLSLLTSDMWSVLIRIFVYHEKHFDEEADVAGSVKLNILARSSNAGGSRVEVIQTNGKNHKLVVKGGDADILKVLECVDRLRGAVWVEFCGLVGSGNPELLLASSWTDLSCCV
ncbi:hypothetical protein E3N88_16555 [Mikania micrantha]|uniref:Uncharacterized protein n=1 Tax=Mikania micrantha TaxID=192012 RepID=A0A5N6P1U1_9ASTR|nr:hypothetical protein E3N88_16555 [Mikania micrantha]